MGDVRKIRIPKALETTLSSNAELSDSVLRVLDSFGRWMDASGMPFFPDFSEHGTGHVTSVMRTAWHLLDDAVRDAMTACDAACLILGTLFHDAGMFLSEDGFCRLVGEEAVGFALPSDPSWRKLWTEFHSEATRWDEEQCLEVYGEPEPLAEVQLDPLSMTKKDRLTIGVFVRRHHHRLAHEIAVRGVPGPHGEEHLSAEAVPEEVRCTAGLLSRSHGLTLAQSVDHLSAAATRDARQDQLAALMACVRVADYLDARPGRAPREVSLTRRASSPRSELEHKLNQCLVSIVASPKQERWLEVTARPPDAATYTRIREWLDGLQDELDCAQAVLSDISYSRQSRPRLRYSRVKSNLDDVEAFARTVDYVPAEIRLRVAENDVIRLLVEPLYGDAPEIGIRELVQNAVDAVRERHELGYSTEDPGSEAQERRDTDVSVVLERDHQGKKWIEVSDHGIGMSLATVESFFLRVGATYRRSTEWRLRFEPTPGRPSVLRSGRFGIGVLAAFLLGKRVSVDTRHVDADEDGGLSFEVDLGKRNIDVRRLHRPVGTRIRVEVNHDVWRRLREKPNSWDWYHLAWPSVRRYLTEDGESIEQKSAFTLPAFGRELPIHWHAIGTSDYPEIHWTLIEPAARLCCNGIDIRSPETSTYLGSGHPGVVDQFGPFEGVARGFAHIRKLPTMSVSDPHGRLPINLQRTGLTSYWVPFQRPLYEDMMKDLVASMLLSAPSLPPCGDCSVEGFKRLVPRGYPTWPGPWVQCDFSHEKASWMPWFVSPQGAGAATYWNVVRSGARTIRFVTVRRAATFDSWVLPSRLLEGAELLVVVELDDAYRTPVAEWLGFALLRSGYGKNVFSQLRATSQGCFARTSLVDWVGTLKRLPKGFKETPSRTEVADGVSLLSCVAPGGCPGSFAELASTFDMKASPSVLSVAQWELDAVQPRRTLSLFEEVWKNSLIAPLSPTTVMSASSWLSSRGST